MIAGAVDLHVHTAPDIVPRRYSDLELAQRALEHGLGAVMLKCHVESTVGRAQAAREATGFEVVGGLVVNSGLNAQLVEDALWMGARIIWLPTIRVPGDDLWFDTSVARTILASVAAHDAVLATGHASAEVVRRSAELGADVGARVLVTHADFRWPALSLEAQEQLAFDHPHLTFERCAYGSLPGQPHQTPTSRVAEAVAVTGGPARNVVSSDLGQVDMPAWPQGLDVFAHDLVDAGLGRDEVRQMLVDTPRRLLRLAAHEKEPARVP